MLAHVFIMEESRLSLAIMEKKMVRWYDSHHNWPIEAK